MKPLLILLLASTPLTGTMALAQSAARPEVRLSGHKVAVVPTATGLQETLQPLKELRPGEVIEYEASYVNPTARTLHDVQVTIPVPSGGLEYIALQKSPLAQSASVDGKTFAPLPLMRVETTADGHRVTRAVPLADYRVLRWTLGDVPAGTARSVRARMQLPAVPVAGAALATAPAPATTASTSRRD